VAFSEGSNNTEHLRSDAVACVPSWLDELVVQESVEEDGNIASSEPHSVMIEEMEFFMR
jgi:hypothetical protein